jgi:hypothetical protein
MPSHNELTKKAKEITLHRERQLTQTELDEMIKAKKVALNKHTNRAREQVILNQAKEKIKQDGMDESQEKRMKELDEKLQNLKDTEQPILNKKKQEAWTEINQRNRKMRFAQGQAAEELMRKQARAISPGKAPRKDVMPSLGQFLTENGELHQDANGYYRPESQRVLRLLKKTDGILKDYLDKPSDVKIVVESDDDTQGLTDGVGKSLFELALAQYDLDTVPIPPVDEYVL